MGRPRRSDEDMDWYNVFLTAFSHEGAVRASSDDSAAMAPRGSFFPVSRRRRAADKADDVGLGPEDVPSASEGVDAVGLGKDVYVPAASKGVDESSPVDEDELQEEHVSREHCSKSSPKVSGQKKNNGKLPLNKRKSQRKRKPSVDKQKARANDSEESDYERSLPSSRFSKRRKQQLQNSSSVYSQKVQEVVLLDDEDMEPKEENLAKRNKEEVNREMSDRLNEPKIYYPSRDDQEAIDLTKSDIKCLDPKAFLSSPVINFYIKYIERTRLCNENFRGKFYIFNTYFFGKLEKAMRQPHDFPKLRRWWKGANIFNNAYIILPIHGRGHWSLVIICLPPKERISEPIILHLDSLEMHRSAKILNTVGSYLEKEWRFLSVSEPAWPCLLSDIRKETVKVPQQNNEYDCGVFMLYYIEQFIKEAPARFTTDKLGMFNRRWFKPEEASGLRQRIRELLLEEFERARLNDAKLEADASKGYDSLKDGELEADHSSIMVVEVDGGLGNTIESNGGKKVAASEEASGESGDDANITGGIKVAASQEATKKSPAAGKSIEGMKVAVSEEASGESGDAVKSTGGIKIAESQEASEKSRDAGKSIEGMKVAATEEASEESGVKSTGGIKVAESQEASEKSRDAGKSIVGMKVAELEETSEESGDAVKSTRGIKVAASLEASEEFLGDDKSIESINVAESEEASEEPGDEVRSTGGIKVSASQETSEEFLGDDKSIESISVAESEEASKESGDAVNSTGGIKVAASQEATEESRGAGKSIESINIAESEEASEEPGDEVTSTGGIKVSASQEASDESRNASKSIEGINVAESEEASEASSDAAKSIQGISVAESDETSGELGDTGKTNKGIKVLASEEASMESGYPATIKAEKHAPAFTHVAVLNKGPTSSNKCNEKNAGCVVSAAASCSDSVKDKKGTVKADSGSSKAKKEGKSNVIASPVRLKGNEEVIGSTPIPDGVSDSGVKRSEGNEKAIGSTSMPVPQAVFETTGAKVWVTRVYRPPPFPPGHWSWSSGGSSKDARRKFIEHFCRKK